MGEETNTSMHTHGSGRHQVLDHLNERDATTAGLFTSLMHVLENRPRMSSRASSYKLLQGMQARGRCARPLCQAVINKNIVVIGSGTSYHGSMEASVCAQEVLVPTGASSSSWKKFLAFLGPGLLVASVYVDPGQLVVDMESGSCFRYKLLWALLAANLTGFILQALVARLTIVTGRSFAEECALEMAHPTRLLVWLTVEVASIAADVGYVIGTATAISILAPISLKTGVIITALDTFLALGLQSFGVRRVEAFVGILFGLVLCAYLVEVALIKPDWPGVVDGLIPRLTHSNDKFGTAVWIELLCANVGAAVCPANLMLQSALVRTRAVVRTNRAATDEAIWFNTAETGICLAFATAVNAAMLVLSAAHFFPERVVSLAQGADLLGSVLGQLARSSFAVAMLAAGTSASFTGVLSTQYILEGFYSSIRAAIPPWLLRLVTRGLALAPAYWAVSRYGDDIAAEVVEQAQIVVNVSIPFSLIPLIAYLTSETKVGTHYALKGVVATALWCICLGITALNVYAIFNFLIDDDGLDMSRSAAAFICGIYMGTCAHLAMHVPTVPAEQGWWERDLDDKAANRGAGTTSSPMSV